MEQYDARGLSDQLNIDTPEQVELSFPLAGIGSRFVAIMLDTLLQGFAYGIVVLMFVLFASGLSASKAAESNLSTGAKWFIAAFILFHFCLYWGYFTLFEAYWHGQTPGKRVMKLRVVKDSGRQITFFEALARNLMRTIDALPSLYLIGVITMLLNRANKRLGDLAAGTIVVHELREEQPLFVAQPTTLLAPQQIALDLWAASTETEIFPADALRKLGMQDLMVIEGFFARALDLPMQARSELASRIARQLCAKMQVPVPEGNPERALEAIAHAMRGKARF